MSPVVSPPLWGLHVPGLSRISGYSNVETEYVADVEVRMFETIRDRAVMLVTGSNGSGKSFATARALEAAVAKDPSLEPVWLEFSSRVQGPAMLRSLLPQISNGQAAPVRADLVQLQDIAMRHLSSAFRALVLDEAQLVSSGALQSLRWLHDRTNSNFALIIVGTRELEEHPPVGLSKLPRDLRSRLAAEVRIELFSDDETPGLLAAYHPLFATANPASLSRINRTHARGEFRFWAKFLVRAHRYVSESEGILTDEMCDIILEQLPKGTR